MATVIEQDKLSDISTLDVSVGRRRFPSRWNVSDEAPSSVLQLRESPADADLPQLLGEAIWKRLPWISFRAEGADRAAIIEAYIQSLGELERCRAEVGELLRAACAANIEFRQAVGETHGAARDEALQKKLDEMLAQVSSHWVPIRNVADAQLASQATDVLGDAFQTALESAVVEFAEQFFDMLARLVDRQLFGLVEWLPNHCCRYHFFRQVLIQENNGVVSTSWDDTYFENPTDRNLWTGERVVGRRSHRDVLHGKHFHRLARHQHDVMNSVRTAVGNSRVIMPPAVVRLIKAIPAWLLPLVQVIDGEIFRERIVEKDTRVEDWSQVTVRDEPIVGCEPGVIIGPYVLTGWGPREVEAELQRRQRADEATTSLARVNAARWQAPLLTAATVLVTLITLWLSLQAVRGHGGASLIALGTTTTLGLLWQSAYAHFVARNQPSALYLAYCNAGFFGGLLLLAEWIMVQFIAPLSWWIPLMLIGVVALSAAIARQFRVT